MVTHPPTDGQAPRRSRMTGREIRPGGAVVDRVLLNAPADPFLDLRALADYSSLSVRKLRDYLADAMHPLPSYRVGGKVLVRRSDFDAWVEPFRHHAGADVGRIVEDVLRTL